MYAYTGTRYTYALPVRTHKHHIIEDIDNGRSRVIVKSQLHVANCNYSHSFDNYNYNYMRLNGKALVLCTYTCTPIILRIAIPNTRIRQAVPKHFTWHVLHK